MRNIGMRITRIGYIATIRNGRSIARNGGWPTTVVIPNGSSLHTGDDIRCGPMARMTEVMSGAAQDGGASGIQVGSMLIIRNGRSRIRGGFARTTAGIRSGFIQRIGASILATGGIPTKNTEGS